VYVWSPIHSCSMLRCITQES